MIDKKVEPSSSQAKEIDAATDLNRQRNREKIQSWVMGFSHTSFDEDSKDKEPSLSQYLPSQSTQRGQKISTKLSCDASTAHIENKAFKNNRERSAALNKKGPLGFEPNFPDEDSSAQSPFAAAPPQN